MATFAPATKATRAPAPRFQSSRAAPGVRDVSLEQLRAAQALSREATTISTAYQRVLSRGGGGDLCRDDAITRAATRTIAQRIPALAQANQNFRRAAGLSGLGAVSSMSPTMWGLLGIVVGAGGAWVWLTLR